MAIRIAVTGAQGQVVTSLLERASSTAEIVALGRPKLDLMDRDSVLSALRDSRCDAIVGAAAYTAVDKSEQEPEIAMRVNGAGAGFVAEAAAELGVPLVHISTDYVFDGTAARPYREDDPTAPLGVYGASKLEGETRVLAACPGATILRTAWVYSPFGANFVRTMLRLGETREEVGVVADQLGNPTSALDIADATLAVVTRLAQDADPALRGVFHMTGSGEASWADVAEAIFARAAEHGRAPVRVRRITTADYPTPAKRPANSRLDNSKLARLHGVALPDWRASLAACVDRLLAAAPPRGA
ncbi:dTDP-4-dehydrorhamnose reductase [Methylosinus trichosporium]|uniref:dTDP-4-dehydrorhamnose reductase n=1 Tax=Methylosinus trichosporium (strain ATCC 35070 / NCIMB 11131 / UNIQEM 75 / OB3b) TaxID=595536 RepID=A0A2D2CXS3_METT3|nr:dTDP-4-dehydrorhamnose reductase [Methylosinus trichosporium OB3b]